MLLIACLMLIFTQKFHRNGFSNMEFKNCLSVFFYSTHDNLEIYIDGKATGVLAPAMLYFSSDEVSIKVEYKCQNHCFFQQNVELVNEKTLVMGNITPVINMYA